ncbi:MAG: hypothetical protein L0J08_03780 [Micrococcaceae bacterium]|uniref:hypothetical protein n=1 Tax=unclassified Arthrobacter TaxID=235627 RepID=UPI00264BE8E4|nr:hypothetical protein [Micrococcaceae bacterium]MDN5879528.1 hypothetical protein [Micrococcaceae bacterium]MDN5887729.1 hypothetical protein [Micrococcaceae bacterium]MDN5906012.1 hypothetical protein [Micrococcaceae bacterium]MDN6170324.1 hypothetical protein [Micrococcaceae bacterium]
MVTRSPSPRGPRRSPRRGFSAVARFLLRTLGLLLVAAIVIGIGTTVESRWGPDSRGGGQQMSPQEKASRTMLALAGTAEELATGTSGQDAGSASPSASAPASPPSEKAPTVDKASATELERISTMLRRHVELLTPGLAAHVQQEADQSASAPASPSAKTTDPATPSATAASTTTSVTEVAVELADTANWLLEAATDAASSEVPAVLGSGIEQRLAAQRLAGKIPGDGASKKLPKFVIPEATHAWQDAESHQLPEGSCAAEPTDGATGSPAAPGTNAGSSVSATPLPASSTEGISAQDQASAGALEQASDAAFRLAYGYQMAAVKQPGDSTRKGWELSEASAELGHRLEDLLPAGCTPVREPAYQLPRDFSSKPIASVAEAEGQLAGLLRDAAAASEQPVRPALIAETWLSAERSFTLANTIPDLT